MSTNIFKQTNHYTLTVSQLVVHLHQLQKHQHKENDVAVWMTLLHPILSKYSIFQYCNVSYLLQN